MAWNSRAPRDRATAQILIVFGALVLLFGVGLFVVALVAHNLADTSRLGIPIWLIAPLCAVFGGIMLWQGIGMYRRDRSPRR